MLHINQLHREGCRSTEVYPVVEYTSSDIGVVVLRALFMSSPHPPPVTMGVVYKTSLNVPNQPQHPRLKMQLPRAEGATLA